MVRISKIRLYVLFAMLMLAANLLAQQSGPSTTLPAPVPPQVLAAKKVFISNVPGEISYSPRNAEDDPYRSYNQFYASLKDWAYYDLVSTPEEADLIMEISLSNRPMASSAMVQAPVHTAHLDLVLRDAKTQVVLWWLTEPLQGANRVATGEKNYNQTMTKLVADLKKLVGRPNTQTGNAEKK